MTAEAVLRKSFDKVDELEKKLCEAKVKVRVPRLRGEARVYQRDSDERKLPSLEYNPQAAELAWKPRWSSSTGTSTSRHVRQPIQEGRGAPASSGDADYRSRAARLAGKAPCGRRRRPRAAAIGAPGPWRRPEARRARGAHSGGGNQAGDARISGSRQAAVSRG